MDTTTTSSDSALINLRGDADKVVQFISANPRGFDLLDAADQLGMSAHRLRSMLRTLANFSTSVRVGYRKGFVKARFIPSSIIVEGKPIEVSVATKAVVGSGSASTKSPSEGQTQATDVVWPAMPTIPDPKTDFTWFEKPQYYARMRSKILTHKKHIRLKGPPGIGKSSAAEYLAANENMPMVNIGADSGLRGRQLIGGMTDLGRFEVAQFGAAVVTGKAWAKIDEANGADPDAILVLNSILAPPHKITINGVNHHVHDDFRLFITYNPGLIGTKPLPESLRDRFYPIDCPFPGDVQLRKMLKANSVDVDSEAGNLLVKFGLAVANERKERRVRYDITLRRLIDAWSDVVDGMKPYDALLASVVYGVDDDAVQASIKKILDDNIPH